MSGLFQILNEDYTAFRKTEDAGANFEEYSVDKVITIKEVNSPMKQ